MNKGSSDPYRFVKVYFAIFLILVLCAPQTSHLADRQWDVVCNFGPNLLFAMLSCFSLDFFNDGKD